MQELLVRVAPAIFVLLWSTGFIGARLGLPYAEPFSFLLIRFLITLAILLPLAIWLKSKFPTPSQFVHGMLVGVLLHAAYLGGVFFAIDRGMPAGISALIVSLQPILTLAFAGLFLSETVSLKTGVWFIVGLFGVGLVLWPNIAGQAIDLPLSSLIASAIAVIGISVGTVYQKQFAGGMDLLVGLIAQYTGACIVLAALAVSTETMRFDWNGELVFALFWLIVVLSLGAVALLMLLIKRDSVARTSSLFFMVPGLTVIVANLMFGETMNLLQILGLIIASAAVGFVNATNK